MAEKLFPIDSIPNETRIRNNIYPSLMFKVDAVIRAGDLQLKVVSVNDKKDTVTLSLDGVFLMPKGENETTETIDEKEV